MQEFAGKTAVITGAGSGIGRGMAEYAAASGMNVVVADVQQDALDETVAIVRDAGADVMGVRTDVGDADAVENLAAAAYDRFDAVHLLHNNAGVFQAGISWQRTIADWEWVMRVNFWGVLNGIRSFVPRLLDQESGGDGDIHIVNTSSLAGMTTVAYSSPYVVSKFAAAALTECLAHDFRAQGSSIGVSCLVPGAVDTRIAQSTRNRPDEPPSEAQAPDHWFVAETLGTMTAEQGIAPIDAAAIVFDGIRAGDFWICTTDSYDGILRPRCEAILEHRLPPGAQY
ncbi:MAG: SDR family NAD(P)-dependent oxidoreductase [Acidimicrobiia bacterium]|jgi:NAD(P)-dependent dehydrogenase (short-subunit alcohol dehydrogenase family)